MKLDEMNPANQIFFYRTNCTEADTVGSMGIVKQGFIVHIASTQSKNITRSFKKG